jgi:RimJ/RimL family protein N-acetyltransferase
MEDLTTVILESDRLILQPISLNYAELIFQEFNDEITKYTYSKPAENLKETKDFINVARKNLKNKTDLILTILNKNNQDFLGICGIHRIHTAKPELGIWLKQQAHGNNFGKEAIHLLKNWADRNLNYEYCLYSADRNNIPSRKIPESLGGQVFHEYQLTNQSGTILNLLQYRIYK